MKRITANYDIINPVIGSRDHQPSVKAKLLEQLLPQLELIIENEYHEVSVVRSTGFKGNAVNLNLYVFTDIEYGRLRSAMDSIHNLI